MKRPCLQNKRVGVLRMAFRASFRDFRETGPRWEVFQRYRKRSRRNGKNAGPITKHKFPILHFQKWEDFVKGLITMVKNGQFWR